MSNAAPVRFVPLEEGAEPDFITGNLGEIPVAEDGTGTFTRWREPHLPPLEDPCAPTFSS